MAASCPVTKPDWVLPPDDPKKLLIGFKVYEKPPLWVLNELGAVWIWFEELA